MLATASAAPHASKVLWYLTRGSGLIATVLLTASVVLGIVTTNRVSAPAWPRFLIAALHRNISLFVMVVLGFHVAVAVLDSYAPLAWVDAVLPLHSSYRPVWLGLGALAFDLLLAVIVTSVLRTRLGYRRWRAVHWAAYASWLSAIAHGLGTGSDTKTRWVLVLTAGCVLVVVAAVGWRLSVGWPAHRQLRVGAGAVAALSVIVLTGWVHAGPLRAGWAKQAGTPATLLGSNASTPSPKATAPLPAPGGALSKQFSGSLQGTISQSPVDASGLVRVTLALTATTGLPGRITVVISGQPSAGGGVTETASRVTFRPNGSRASWIGSITTLDGDQLVCALSSGANRINLSLNLSIDGPTGSVTGHMRGVPA